MSNVERLYHASKTADEFAKGYFAYLTEMLASLDTSKIAAFINEIEDARNQGATIFIIGNGGSAATASHMANDLSIGATRAGKDAKPFRAMALTDNVSVMTAVGNDFSYDDIFLSQLQVHYRPGDRIIAISASGNSPNIIKAIEWVKGQGARVMGLVGFDGGKLAPLCDIAIHPKSLKGEYGPVEDVHMILDHVVYSWLKHKSRH